MDQKPWKKTALTFPLALSAGALFHEPIKKQDCAEWEFLCAGGIRGPPARAAGTLKNLGRFDLKVFCSLKTMICSSVSSNGAIVSFMGMRR